MSKCFLTALFGSSELLHLLRSMGVLAPSDSLIEAMGSLGTNILSHTYYHYPQW